MGTEHEVCRNPNCKNTFASKGSCPMCGATWTTDPLFERALASKPMPITARPAHLAPGRGICQNPQCGVETTERGPCHKCGATWDLPGDVREKRPWEPMDPIVVEDEVDELEPVGPIEEAPALPSEVPTEPARAVDDDPA